MKLYKTHLVLGLVWLLVGMTLGQIMGQSGDHSQMPTHAHIMLLGGVLSLAWGLIYRGLDIAGGLLGWVQLLLHNLGAVTMLVIIYMLFDGNPAAEPLEPVIGMGGGAVMLSVLLMLYQVIRAKD
ncbi:hypothetical protein [uncultured Maricaulis sp.]|uniref:hypothetical protein n=1 Tax=uncultured Maricaulis sp. TaxID=174710 RepID=UPI0030D758C7|tara:strand:+ start:17305 stop:17679 length:375 start_codon:yes stop_codon:yes gene_type:complete